MRSKPAKALRLSRIITSHSVAVFALVALGTYTLTLNGPAVVSLIASSASSLYRPPATIFFRPSEDRALTLKQSADIDVMIDARDPINVVGATITFPPELIEIIGISKRSSFLDLWTEDTTIMEQAGLIRFSGGTTEHGGHRGEGTVLTLSVRAKSTGTAELGFGTVEMFASDGSGKVLESSARGYTYTIAEPAQPPITAGGTAIASSSPLSNPDLNDDGTIGVVDMSILAVKLLGRYDARYDLNGDGRVNLGDMSVLFSKL